MAMSIGERYVAARQTSQIQQRAVTINDITPLQSEIVQSMPLPAYRTPSAPRNHYADEYVGGGGYMDDNYYHDPPPPMRANSGGYQTCVVDDTQPPRTEYAPESPRTPKGKISMDNDEITSADATAATAAIDAEATAADDKIVSDLTPSARGVGSRLRHLSRDAIIGMYHRNERGGQNEGDWYGENYSCGGGTSDETFSSHASPACARIGRMLSAPSQPYSTPDRTSTAPF
jgi:hypothetical protein